MADDDKCPFSPPPAISLEPTDRWRFCHRIDPDGTEHHWVERRDPLNPERVLKLTPGPDGLTFSIREPEAPPGIWVAHPIPWEELHDLHHALHWIHVYMQQGGHYR